MGPAKSRAHLRLGDGAARIAPVAGRTFGARGGPQSAGQLTPRHAAHFDWKRNARRLARRP